jgi:hypothetical protein
MYVLILVLMQHLLNLLTNDRQNDRQEAPATHINPESSTLNHQP